MSTAPPSDPTADLAPAPDAGARGAWVRRGFLAVLATVVGLALFGWLGVRSRSTRAQSADGSLAIEVTYAQVARAGLDVPFRVKVTRPGGFAGQVSVRVSSAYLELFDVGGVHPEASGGSSTPVSAAWEFDRPRGPAFEFSLDMQVQGGKHFGRSGLVVVRDHGDGATARATFKTWLAP